MHKLDDFGLLLFLKQFSVLLSEGYSVADSLELISKNTSYPLLKKHLVLACKKLNSGKTIYEALFEKDHPFPNNMATCFRSMPQKNHELKLTIKSLEERHLTSSGLFHMPANLFFEMGVLFLFGIGVLLLFVLFLVFVIPVYDGLLADIQEMFVSMGGALPAPTQMFLKLGLLFKKYWFFALLITALFFYFLYSKRLRSFKSDEFFYIFSLMLGQLKSGANIKQALSWAADSLENHRLGKHLNSVIKTVDNGKTLSESIRQEDCFPVLVPDVIAMGEKKGDLKPSIEELVSYYTRKKKIDSLMIIYPYAVLFVLIFLLGLFMIAMYLPIFKISSVVAG